MLQEDRFCPRCAAPLELRKLEGKERPVCSSCSKVIYYDPKITAAAIVEKDGKVLMVRRGTQPGLGLWSLPGGYMDRGEVVEAAAVREVLEETGLVVRITGLVGLFSEPGHPVVLAAYDAQIVDGSPKPGPEVMELDFFPLGQLPPLAFPRDRQILEAWKRLRDSAG